MPATMEAPYIWEGKAGEPSTKVKVFDLDTRRTVDREAAQKGVAFMERNVKAKTPFFLYYPITQIHFPTLAHPDFDGKTGAGDIGDAMADVDYNTGLVLDAIDRLGIARNTIVFWCTDNGAEIRRPWRGSSGPWSGFYNSVMEGGIRTPCIVRWPGRIPAGRVVERDRPSDRHLPDARRGGRRRHRAEGPRDSTASISCRSSRASSRSRIARA